MLALLSDGACHAAVAHLRARGFRVRRLEAGYPEWRAAGLPVEADVRP